jgi:hypothetical protein
MRALRDILFLAVAVTAVGMSSDSTPSIPCCFTKPADEPRPVSLSDEALVLVD